MRNPEDESQDALRDELSRLDGTKKDGPTAVIWFPKRQVYLSGYPYMFTQFGERAYEMGEPTARRLIAEYPLVLHGAEVRVRERF